MSSGPYGPIFTHVSRISNKNVYNTSVIAISTVNEVHALIAKLTVFWGNSQAN